MLPPPHLAATAVANPRIAAAAFPAGSSRRRPRHRGAMMSVSCCRVAALASLLAVGAATAFLTFSLPSSPRVFSTTEFTRELSARRSAPPPPPPTVTRAKTPPPPPLLPSTTPPPAARRRKREPSYWRMAPEEALRYAKKEIRDAVPVVDDPDLYAPLFKNVSQFKRSYELMERILKVYIYQDGRRPIFHTPPLSGIYASEGWFMKLLKESRRFVAADASKAHLFYLPYSSQQLRRTLYVANSHNLRPLAVYLRNFVRGLANKYPFWNRTRGADHFLVACHDWGPYTTTSHGDLRRNTIKALCNADSSEGIFTLGKDVSLPETTIRAPKRPLRYVGGLPVSRRGILAFFAGNVHGRVRPVLLKHWGNGQDDDMRVYELLPNRVSRRMSYIQHMKNSRFCLCPMGHEVNSPRIVEAFYYECVPVIIADNFVLPLSEVLDWSAFSVVVAEKDIPDLKRILQGISLRRYVVMHNCVKRLQRHFLWHARPIVKYDLFHMILHSIWLSRVNQVQLED
ncbi:probable glycosyltransferase At5g03795 [Phragmites australis]|uniref:probable glycosyltransferase At5g03795 n=1 Tax=Phragmites australis TaxID=29695 RepID=UPI002D77707F|nr:probable glycosyltransferase At5g03795 [Phragmites australis]